MEDILVYLEDKDEEEKIRSITKQIYEDPEDNENLYKSLLEAKYSTGKARKLLFNTLLDIRKLYPAELNRTLKVILNFLQDEDEEVRKFATKKVITLCKEGKNVSQVSNVLAQLVGQGGSTAPTAEESLRQLVNQHPKEAILSIYTVMDEFPCHCDKLKLLKYLDGEVRRLGTIGDAMRKKIYDVFYDMLNDESVNKRIEDIKKVFFYAVGSSFFPNAVDRIALVQKARLKLDFENNPEVVEMYETALSLATWIDEPCDFAADVVSTFLSNMNDADERNVQLEDSAALGVFKVIIELTRMKKEFVYLPKYFTVCEEHFSALYNMFLRLSYFDDEDERKLLGFTEDELIYIEHSVFMLYNLMPLTPANVFTFSSEGRKLWTKQAHNLVIELKTRTEEYKTDLNLRNAENRASKNNMQKTSLNIGIIVMDFMRVPAKRNHIVVPSWLPIWKPPKIVPSSNEDERPPRIAHKRRQQSSPPNGRRTGSRSNPIGTFPSKKRGRH